MPAVQSAWQILAEQNITTNQQVGVSTVNITNQSAGPILAKIWIWPKNRLKHCQGWFEPHWCSICLLFCATTTLLAEFHVKVWIAQVRFHFPLNNTIRVMNENSNYFRHFSVRKSGKYFNFRDSGNFLRQYNALHEITQQSNGFGA